MDFKSAQPNSFKIDVDQMQVLTNTANAQNTITQSYDGQAAAELHRASKEDDEGAGGFFITGINTGAEVPFQPEETRWTTDPIDFYKHVAVVDCNKAFSNTEVSYIGILVFDFVFFIVVCFGV